RHVRVTHLGQDERFAWTVRELFVYEANDPRSGPSADPPAAAAALLAMGVRRVYADHGEGPRLAEAARRPLFAVPDNVRVDRYGLRPSLERLPFLTPAPDAAVAYRTGTASDPSIEAVLRSAGVSFSVAEAGGYRLLGRLAPARLPGRLAQVQPVR